MTKIVSITMAIIIMLTAGITAPQTYAAAPQTIIASVKAKPSSQTNKKKKKHKHNMPKGNMGKWFKSKKAIRKYVSKVMKKYSRQYENGEITWDEYVCRCPYGYEAWACSCGKWSGNFKYHKVRSIDINYYIKYAKSYVKQIGLEYDKTATDFRTNCLQR